MKSRTSFASGVLWLRDPRWVWGKSRGSLLKRSSQHEPRVTAVRLQRFPGQSSDDAEATPMTTGSPGAVGT